MRETYLESLNRAMHFIEMNLDKKIVLRDIAQAAYLSEFHFHRIFKSLTGETVKKCILRLKIEKAAVRLKHSTDDIGDISMDSGFENHETFSRAFKRHFSQTPQDYREAIKEVVVQKKIGYRNAAVNLSNVPLEEPIIQQIPALHLAYVRHTGSYDQVAASFQRLMLWAASHLVLKWRPVTVGILHDDPDLTAEDKIRFDACVILRKPIQPKGEIGYKAIEGGKFAVFRYKGQYENFYKVYDYVYNVCLIEKGWTLADKPALEWYVKSPPFYKPENYVTDFYVPIK